VVVFFPIKKCLYNYTEKMSITSVSLNMDQLGEIRDVVNIALGRSIEFATTQNSTPLEKLHCDISGNAATATNYTTAPEWVDGQVYAVGDIVRMPSGFASDYAGKLVKVNTAGTLPPPDTTGFLMKIDEMSESNIEAVLDNIKETKAPLADPTFTGMVTAPIIMGTLVGNASSAATASAAEAGSALKGALAAKLDSPAFTMIFGGDVQQIGEDIVGKAEEDKSGYSVSLSADGTIVAVGAIGNDGDPNLSTSNSGHVRVYQLVDGDWTQLGQDIYGKAENDQSGYSVSLSSDGTIVAIGAHNNDNNGTNSGHVRVYQLVDGTWTQIGIDIDGKAENDQSGYSVSLNADGTIVAIGAPYNDNNGTYNSGHVRVYQLVDGAWLQMGQDIDGETGLDYSGISVSLSADGTIVAIGADYNDGDPGNPKSDSGHVRVFEYVSLEVGWTQMGQDIDGEATSDQSGWSVSLNADGTIVAVGATGNDGDPNLSNSGHVCVYQLVDGDWTQLGQDIDGKAENDQSGYSVSLNADGTIVAIGAPYNDNNGNNSGHVRVYQLVDGTWTQIGIDIDGKTEEDKSGYSVSLSADGAIVAIGAPYSNNNGTYYSGHVRVYQLGSRFYDLFGNAQGISLDNGSYRTVDCNISGNAAAATNAQGISLDNGSYRTVDCNISGNAATASQVDNVSNSNYMGSLKLLGNSLYPEYQSGNYSFMNSGQIGNTYNSGWTVDFALVVNGNAKLNNLYVTSDRRIKENIEDVPDALALEQVRKIPCRYYEYKDKRRGSGKTVGFIAQEVKEILPMAVHTTDGILPDHMRLAEASWEEVDGKHLMTVSNLDADVGRGTKMKFIGATITPSEQKEEDSVKIPASDDYSECAEEVVMRDDGKFEMKKQYSQVFIYGREVNELNVVCKDKIFALHHSAIQELDKTVEAQKATIAAQAQELADQKALIQSLVARMDALEA
jgi:hypothetical protein